MIAARMRRTLGLVMVVGLLITAVGTDAQQSGGADAKTLLGQALHLEEVEGNCPGAIEIYRKLVSAPKIDRAVAARALLQLGGCYERLGQPEARATYEQVVKQHQDSGPIVAAARAKLAALQATPPGPTERIITNDRYFGGVGGPRISPDGRWVLGFRLTPTEFDGTDLYLRSLENASGRTLFFRAPGFAGGFKAFSPDSRRYAALMPHMPPQSAIAEGLRAGQKAPTLTSAGVFVVGTVEAGSTPTVIDIAEMAAFNAFEPFTNPIAWSPDGRLVAFAMPVSPLRTYEVHVIDVTTGARRSLGYKATGSLDLMWAPSGRELLVHLAAAAPTVAGELRLITVETGEARSLPLPGAPGARLRLVRWNPNGEIAIHLQPATPQVEDWYLLAADSGRSRKTCSGLGFNLAGSGGHPSATADICREITADGRRQIVWRHATKQLVIRDVATGTDTPLTTSPGEEYYGTLSPDDRLEVFISNREGRWALYSAEIARAPVPRPTRLAVFDDMPSFDLRTWTPNGFIGSVQINESNILRVNVDPASGKATGNERLTQDGILNHTPAISPDGRQIVYWSRRGSRFGLAVMASNGADERLLLEAPQYAGLAPSWRSTSEVLFMQQPPGANQNVFVPTPATTPLQLLSVNTVTGSTSPMGDLTGTSWLRWQSKYLPATGEVYSLDPDRRTLRARSLVSGATRLIATFPPDAVISFLPTPDGRRIAFAIGQAYDENQYACFAKTGAPAATVNDIVRQCEIQLLDLATGERSVLTTTPGQNAATPALIAWSPDSRFLLFGGGRPLVFDTKEKTRWPLLEQSVPLDWDRTASWSPDGTFIVLTTRSQRFEWRQWTGVR